jgi:hypothetical protein
MFGCAHRRTTFPQTPKKGARQQQTYVACLDCGKEFHYDWSAMRRGGAVTPESPREWRPAQEQLA